uniref:NADH-ubiquinone oxidoreductase chain 6 n=1 Tax=Pseudomictis brevicornis TaxID=2575661 RepID=A0A4D6X4K0_9HEMI|nr:NADH dehydrogenase subunit 6 [Pseudomictis brevicornis]QCI09440.1 NADH dehydrogenase subunit 6 [Pseudomictis brevicornis]
MMMLFFLMMTLAFVFMWLNHPISMGITIIMQTLIVALVSGLYLGSFWFSYIIMITMLSGMLVLFIYMASVASNEKFYTSIKLIAFSVSMIMTSMIVQWMSKNYDNEFMMTTSNLPVETMSLNNLFSCKFKFITMIMVLYLFFTMITVSSIVNISQGPLRINKK